MKRVVGNRVVKSGWRRMWFSSSVRSTLLLVPNPQEDKIKEMILNVSLWIHSGIPREQNKELATT